MAAHSPQLVLQGLARLGNTSIGIRIIGSDPVKQEQVTQIQKFMLKGKFSEIGGAGNRLVAGKKLLSNLGATVNDTIFLTVGSTEPVPFKIVGSFELGVKSIDETTVFAFLPDVQRLNRTPSRISDIAVRLSDVREASGKASEWAAYSNEKVQSWDQANEGIMSVFTTQDIVRNTMTISILIVVGFGIYNILSIAVTHKRKEIAILRSIGFEPNDIVQLFLTQGALLGIVGGAVGSLLGFLLCLYLTTIEISGDRGLGGNHMIIYFSIWIYVRAFFLALGAATFAGFLPARAAGRLEPIDIIRTEGS